jgi:hypothetical protein
MAFKHTKSSHSSLDTSTLLGWLESVLTLEHC